MLAINARGVLIDTGAYKKPQFYIKKYTINTLVFIWKLFFKTLAFGLSVLSFTLKVLAYLFSWQRHC